jgi:iron(III) transport system ATP-binding protein
VRDGRIRTDLGEFAGVPGIGEGAPVEVMIRPDDVDFVPDPQGAASIVDRQFRGPVNLYRLRLTSGTTVHSVQPSTTVYPAGQRVRVTARLVHVVAYPL